MCLTPVIPITSAPQESLLSQCQNESSDGLLCVRLGVRQLGSEFRLHPIRCVTSGKSGKHTQLLHVKTRLLL